MPTRVIVFDIDGTLVDSNDAHAAAWVETLQGDGVTVAFDVVRRCIGMGSDKLLPAVASIDAESPRGKKLAERRAQLFKDNYFAKLRPFPQTRELFERLISLGLRVGIATSARGDELKKLLDLASVRDLVDENATSDDVESSKPEPDIVQVALSKLKTSPDEAIMVGDTPYDIAAAVAASVRTIAFRCGGWNDADLRGASAIYDGPSAMLQKFDLVSFDRTRPSASSA